MRPRYLQPEAAGRDRWMISYLDVLSILLIFFVALASKSLAVPPKPAPIPPPHAPAAGPLAELETRLAQKDKNLQLKLEARGLVISLPQSVLFRPGDDRIAPGALPLIGEIAEVLHDIPNQITLAGHADPVPVHNRRFRNNWQLAAGRSLGLLEVLSQQYGIADSRLSIASYGANDPKSSNATPAGRAENRRVEIVILNSQPK